MRAYLGVLTMKKLVIVFASLIPIFLTGCGVTKSQPNFFNGYWFITGDSRCTQFRPYEYDETFIRCYNSEGEFTDLRYAMTSEQIQKWQSEKRE